MIGGVTGGWIAGLGFGFGRPRFARLALLAILFSILAILASVLLFETQSARWSWIGWAYVILAGAVPGLLGPTLIQDDRLLAFGLSLIIAPFMVMGLASVAAAVACSVGGCL